MRNDDSNSHEYLDKGTPDSDRAIGSDDGFGDSARLPSCQDSISLWW